MSKPGHYTKAMLEQFEPLHKTFVGIDSDGCVFPTMEIKQIQCFHGLIVSFWHLEAIEKALREVAEFVNLRSRNRGLNRFPALALTFELLRDHPDARAAGVAVPDTAALRAFIDSGTPLGTPGLESYLARNPDPALKRVMAWTKAVNEEIARKVSGVPPYRWVRESLVKVREHSDVICVSQTPTEALVREWDENDLTQFVCVIAGQELGTKTEHLAMATTNRYGPDRVLMIGDAPGDRKAAEAVNARFYPIVPGAEEASWERFFREAYARFLDGTYGGPYEKELIRLFNKALPTDPPWLPSRT